MRGDLHIYLTRHEHNRAQRQQAERQDNHARLYPATTKSIVGDIVRVLRRRVKEMGVSLLFW
jgi:hypothetical protein